MALTVTAKLYWILPPDGAPPVTQAVAAFAATHNPAVTTEFAEPAGNFRLGDFDWSARHRVCQGTLYRVRQGNLPSHITPRAVQALPIGARDGIGEALCFAYKPGLNVIAVQHGMLGPRPSQFAHFLGRIGYAHPLQVAPVLRRDVSERLRDANIVRSINFRLTQPDRARDEAAREGSVDEALSILDEFGGTTVEVSVSMSRERGSLSIEKAKRLARRLSQVGDTCDKLRVGVKTDEESPVDLLDLIQDHLIAPIQVAESGRELDKMNCCGALVHVLDQHEDEILAQTRDGRLD